jgi:hypothetical protein
MRLIQRQEIATKKKMVTPRGGYLAARLSALVVRRHAFVVGQLGDSASQGKTHVGPRQADCGHMKFRFAKCLPTHRRAGAPNPTPRNCCEE